MEVRVLSILVPFRDHITAFSDFTVPSLIFLNVLPLVQSLPCPTYCPVPTTTLAEDTPLHSEHRSSLHIFATATAKHLAAATPRVRVTFRTFQCPQLSLSE